MVSHDVMTPLVYLYSHPCMSSCTTGEHLLEGALCDLITKTVQVLIRLRYYRQVCNCGIDTVCCGDSLLSKLYAGCRLKAEGNPILLSIPPLFRHSRDRRDWEGFIRLEGGISWVLKEDEVKTKLILKSSSCLELPLKRKKIWNFIRGRFFRFLGSRQLSIHSAPWYN